MKFLRRAAMISLFSVAPAMAVRAEATWQGTAVADAFLAAGSPGNPKGSDLSANNYGGAGTLAVAPASSLKGEFQSVVMFNLAAALSVFDGQYGSGNWQITNMTLTLSSNFGIQGAQPNNDIFNTINTGGFVIEWLADDTWTQGTGNPNAPSLTGVNFDSLGTLVAGSHEVVGNYTYVPPGSNANVPITWTLGLTSGFLADASALGNVSFLFHAADTGNVGYLFNTGSAARLTLTAVPEPATVSFLLGAVAVFGLTLRRSRHK